MARSEVIQARTPSAPSTDAAANLVWHATVVAGAMSWLGGDKSASFAPARTDPKAWGGVVREPVRAAERASIGSWLTPIALLREVLCEIHAIAAPLPRDLRSNNLPLGLMLEIRRACSR